MKTLVSSRKVVNVSDSTRQLLHAYTLAASAAGVTILALAQPGEAEIIYTPANVRIYANDDYWLSLTGDGTTDFIFSNYWGPGGGTLYFGRLWVGAAVAGNEIIVNRKGDAAALPSGHRIGPNAPKFGSEGSMAFGYFNTSNFRYKCYGPWNGKTAYLGLKFMINGEVHYGWARLSASCGWLDVDATLTGYAYETIPNRWIKAGDETGTLDESLNGTSEPALRRVPVPAATLGMLARGAQGLGFWRREQDLSK
jgi:hypothetical protein